MKTHTGIRQLVQVFRTLGWIIFGACILLACYVTAMPLFSSNDLFSPSLRILGATFGGFLSIGFVAAGVAYSSVLFFSAAVLELLLDIQANTFEGKMFLHRALTAPKSKPSQETSR